MLRRFPPPVNRALGRLFGELRVRIRGGPNRGLWWSLASSGRGYGSGRFEAPRVHALVGLLRPGDCFWDVGAHKGYVALAASRAVGPEGRVLAFEPSDVNRDFLRRHVRWNRLENVQPFPFALTDTDGEARFGGASSTLAHRLGGGEALVPTRTVDSLVERHGLPAPGVLKIDAEHEEAAVLRGAERSLSRIGLVWISLHSRALYEECGEILRAHGFRLFESASLAERIADPALPWGEDQELLAAGPHSALSSQHLRRLSLFAP